MKLRKHTLAPLKHALFISRNFTTIALILDVRYCSFLPPILALWKILMFMIHESCMWKEPSSKTQIRTNKLFISKICKFVVSEIVGVLESFCTLYTQDLLGKCQNGPPILLYLCNSIILFKPSFKPHPHGF